MPVTGLLPEVLVRTSDALDADRASLSVTQMQRVRRLRGQVEAIERALQKDSDCAKVMQLTVSALSAASSPRPGP